MPELQEVVKPHPHFMLFATQNPPGIYAGRKTLSRWVGAWLPPGGRVVEPGSGAEGAALANSQPDCHVPVPAPPPLACMHCL